MQATPGRAPDAQTDIYPPVDPDDAAHVARLGALVDRMVTRDRQPALLAILGRVAQGMTQAQLADATGLGRGVIARIESGATPCTRERSLILSPYLDVPAWALADWSLA